EILLGLLFMLAGPYLAPLPIMILGCLVCLIQTFIFMMLSIVYSVEAMAEGH
ncbi:MAG TPA: F0F1 ATP synthase subunit A, partial [Deltaproteobacteria bacterium]|nr:F0F1 ATP synthase subunit A [Deltaproteobacteria bacterium]